MNDPFVAPSADAAPPVPELSEVDAEHLAYVHATLAPKLLYGLALGLASSLSAVGVVFGALSTGVDLSSVSNAVLSGAGLLLAGLAGLGGVAALRASEASPAWTERALLLELRGWQLAAAATAATYVMLCGGLVLAVLR